MKNNKGFTLIELLSVFVILSGISLIAVMGISASLEKRNERECEEQMELAINAAKIYFALNDDVSPTDGVQIVTLKGGYFNENSKINRLDDNVYVKISNGNYVYDGECHLS